VGVCVGGVCVCGCVWCVSVCVCVCMCVGTHLVQTMSWNVLEIAWKVGLYVQWVVVCCQLFCDQSVVLAVYCVLKDSQQFIFKPLLHGFRSVTVSFAVLYCTHVYYLICASHNGPMDGLIKTVL